MGRGRGGVGRSGDGRVGTARAGVGAALALALGGCASMLPHRPPPPPPPPPAGYHVGPDGTVVGPADPAAGEALHPAARVAASHRQYFDQRRKRYYFYDPARRAYFWEDGSPKT